MTRVHAFTGLALGALAAGACLPHAAGAQQAPAAPAAPAAPVQAQQANGTVYDVLMADPRFTTMMKMVYVAGRADRLETTGPVTIFAATNQGWDGGNYGGFLSSLTSTGATSEFPQPTEIVQVLRGFFVRGEPTLNQAGPVRMQSVAGRPVEYDPQSMTVRWVDTDGATRAAKVDGSPIVTTNGVVYPVDAVVGS